MAVRFSELLLREQRITPAQLEVALGHQRASGGRLGATLVRLGLLSDEDVALVLSRQYGVPAVQLSDLEIDPAVIRLIPVEAAVKHEVVPVARQGATLTLAMTDPANVGALDDIAFITGLHVEPVVASDAALQQAIGKYYRHAVPGAVRARPVTQPRPRGPAGTSETADLEVVDDVETVVSEEKSEEENDGTEDGGEPTVIQLVNALMLSAIQRGASDIHVEPYEKDVRVRYRVDGVLRPVPAPPLKYRDAITSRIKILAHLDIAEKRLPQDGRIKARFNDRGRTRDVDFRVSCLPTLFGEKVVLRLLDPETLRLDLTALGFETLALERFQRAIRRPWGLVLVTGPTGSGKTSTLYSALAHINQPGVNVLTVEDPVEFNLPGINQVQVRDQIGLTFAAALRAFLRQDPNVILVGEIRDAETASIAVKAALTGHLVLSTLHANDAATTVNRLVNMGVEPYLVAGSVNVLCAQRLVRRVCKSCKTARQVPAETLVQIGFREDETAGLRTVVGRGCQHCGGTGYRGRIGVFEVMEMSESLRDLVRSNAPVPEIRKQAAAEGMPSLRESGRQKLRDGVTTIEEVMRETV
ncbi:MAG TPA: type IV-A pilus assembly ATPase PilB [Vicinamibacterales bacterium]|nr:type IV-A pilus assembly ATPase PilB [Vicinamibacterales bacterium]